jgi:hypothetical protein
MFPAASQPALPLSQAMGNLDVMGGGISEEAAERESLAFLLHEPRPEIMTMVILELVERLEQLDRRVEALERRLRAT